VRQPALLRSFGWQATFRPSPREFRAFSDFTAKFSGHNRAQTWIGLRVKAMRAISIFRRARNSAFAAKHTFAPSLTVMTESGLRFSQGTRLHRSPGRGTLLEFHFATRQGTRLPIGNDNATILHSRSGSAELTGAQLNLLLPSLKIAVEQHCEELLPAGKFQSGAFQRYSPAVHHWRLNRRYHGIEQFGDARAIVERNVSNRVAFARSGSSHLSFGLKCAFAKNPPHGICGHILPQFGCRRYHKPEIRDAGLSKGIHIVDGQIDTILMIYNPSREV
jgi:hypothetical protein